MTILIEGREALVNDGHISTELYDITVRTESHQSIREIVRKAADAALAVFNERNQPS